MQYSTNGVNWFDISDPLYNNWYDVASQQWITEALGPNPPISGVANLYKRIDSSAKPWTFPDLIVRWDTTKVPDGFYTLRIVGKKLVSGNIVDAANLTIDQTYGKMLLQIDNSTPKCQITGIWHKVGNVETKKEGCDFIDFTTGSIIVRFDTTDAKGHLRNYSLNAMYGHNQVVVPIPNHGTDDYSTHLPSKTWSGGAYTIEYSSAQHSSSEMPKCAYQFRLRVDKRTTNGYGPVYWGYEDTLHVTILR